MEFAAYVDESGRFNDPDDTVVVGGLLIPASDLLEKEVHLQLQRVAPRVPWPIHAWLLGHQSMFVLWRLRTAGAGGPDAATASARAALLGDEPNAFARAQRALQLGFEPSSADLFALDKVLRRRGRIIWEAEQEGTFEALCTVMDAVAASTAKHAAVVMAAETRPADAMPVAPARTPDRYTWLLACLAERIAHAVGRMPGAHRVTFHVMTRKIYDAAAGRDVMLTSEHVARAVALLVPDGHYERQGTTVDLVAAADVGRRDRALPALLVLADIVVNRARRQLRGDVRWETLARRLREVLRLAPTVAGHPAGAASGLARDYIEDARRGAAIGRAHPLFVTPDVRPWTADQADRWADTFTRDP